MAVVLDVQIIYSHKSLTHLETGRSMLRAYCDNIASIDHSPMSMLQPSLIQAEVKFVSSRIVVLRLFPVTGMYQ